MNFCFILVQLVFAWTKGIVAPPVQLRNATATAWETERDHPLPWYDAGWSDDVASRLASNIEGPLVTRFAFLANSSAITREDRERAFYGLNLLFLSTQCLLGVDRKQSPRTITGPATVSCCDFISAQWSRSSWEFIRQQDHHFYTTSTIVSTGYGDAFEDGSCSGPFTELCDGVPRAMCAPAFSEKTTLFTTVELHSSPIKSGSIVPYPIPKPKCTVSEDQCSSLWEDFYTARIVPWQSRESVSIYRPTCKEEDFSILFDECYFNHRDYRVNLIHWWSEVGVEHICPRSTTKTPSIGVSSLPSTLVYNNATLTSPSKYVFYSTMYHAMGLGRTHYNVAIPLAESDILVMYESTSQICPGTSSCYTIAQVREAPLDLDDLAYQTIFSNNSRYSFPLVNATHYANQPECNFSNRQCKTIYHNWQPRIAFSMHPLSLQAVDPEWSRCGYELHRAWDPPLALKPTSTLSPPMLTAFPLINNPMVVEAISLKPGAGISPPFSAPTAREQKISQVEGQEIRATRTGSTRTVLAARKLNTYLATSVSQAAPIALPKESEFIRDSEHGLFFVSETSAIPSRSQSIEHKIQAVFNAGGQTFTALQIYPGQFVIDGKTLYAGEARITFSGATLSALSNGIVVEDNGSNHPTSAVGEISNLGESISLGSTSTTHDVSGLKTGPKKGESSNLRLMLEMLWVWPLLALLHI